jgi:hypothetical protein
MLSRSNLIAAVFILAVVALTVEGYYVYSFYQDYRSPGSGRAALAESPEEIEESTVAPSNTFVHRAGPDNISANSTYLDGPSLNGKPEAVVLINQSWNPGGGSGTYNDHPVGVWYDSSRDRWAIFNQDRADMPRGAAFNVVVSGGAG